MPPPLKILVVFGTRPEVIKLAPLIKKISEDKDIFELTVCSTGQHREMVEPIIKLFKLKIQYNLNLMKKNQSLSDLTSEVLLGLSRVIKKEKPDLIIVQGDTTTTFAASLAAFYEKVPVGHVEAGLRTGNNFSPWPEEVNRKLTSIIADIHFAPTNLARENLINDNVPPAKIFVTGNTVIDALLQIIKKIKTEGSLKNDLEKDFSFIDKKKKLILVTGHRRENFGNGFENICFALKELITSEKNIQIVYPVHLNPNVREPVFRILGLSDQNPIKRIHLIEPLDYLHFVYLMDRSYLILTDSGGIQEEAPSLGKPVLVMRDTTERPEAIAAGTVRLVGTSKQSILTELKHLINDESLYKQMSLSHNPYGDGEASNRITNILKSQLFDSIYPISSVKSA